MTNTEAKEKELEKLVEDIPLVSYDMPVPKTPSTKKHSQKTAQPTIRSHMVKGRPYYYYCRGTDKEIYLGSARGILKAVKGKK